MSAISSTHMFPASMAQDRPHDGGFHVFQGGSVVVLSVNNLGTCVSVHLNAAAAELFFKAAREAERAFLEQRAAEISRQAAEAHEKARLDAPGT